MDDSAPATPSADVDLVDAVSRALVAASDLDPAAIHVTADAGSVRLRGLVATHAERLAAANRASGVAGVREVHNDLTVRDLALAESRLTDAEVAEGATAALRDSTVRIQGLRVAVRQHVVTLEGAVGSERDRAAARHAAQNAPGVHFVEDRLEVVTSAEADSVEELTPADSYALIGAEGVGRLAVQDPAGVDVFPVNYVVSDGTVYFRSGPGTKMIRVTEAPQVAFEVDGFEGDVSWSVVVRGVAQRLDSDEEILASGIADAATAHPTEKLNYVKITPEQVTGRRFRS